MTKELIKSLGGSKAVADEAKVTESAVRNWIMRDSVSWSKRHVLAIMAAERGVALPVDFWEDRKP